MSHPKRHRRSEIVVPHSPKWHQRLVAWLIWVVASAISATILLAAEAHDPLIMATLVLIIAAIDGTAISGQLEAAAAEGHMQQALKSLFAVAEAYPQLQASQNFLQLQQSVVDTEDKIQASRRFYNGGVRELNTKIKIFPNTLFVRGLGFTEREFFEVVDGAAISEPPRVQF